MWWWGEKEIEEIYYGTDGAVAATFLGAAFSLDVTSGFVVEQLFGGGESEGTNNTCVT